MNPTNKQIRELWEWVEGCQHEWHYNYYTRAACPKCHEWRWNPEKLKPINFNNLVEHALPKAYRELCDAGKYYKLKTLWDSLERAISLGEDPTLAFFWALWEVKESDEPTN